MFQVHSPTEMVTAKLLKLPITDIDGVVHRVRIPEGFVFDGASIPRVAWSLIGAPFEPDFIVAACVHDWYCDRTRSAHDYQARVIGDAVFFKLLSDAGVPLWRRTAMYAAVRLNTIFRYWKDRKP